MPNYSRNDVVLVKYPFTDLSGTKVRPAIVVSSAHSSADLIIVPLTSRIKPLMAGEFVLSDWAVAGLNVSSAVKRGLFTIQENLAIKRLGTLRILDAGELDRSLQTWLGL